MTIMVSNPFYPHTTPPPSYSLCALLLSQVVEVGARKGLWADGGGPAGSLALVRRVLGAVGDNSRAPQKFITIAIGHD